jgi:hypothetical protein
MCEDCRKIKIKFLNFELSTGAKNDNSDNFSMVHFDLKGVGGTL